MAGVRSYHVEARLHVEGTMPLGEPVDAEFGPGDHEPRSEQEEWALEHAASLGLASPVPVPGPAAKRAKGA